MVRCIEAGICHGIVALRRQGLRQKTIARRYHITQGAVSKILKRFRETGLVTSRPRSGRPLKTSGRDDRDLLRICRRNRTQTVGVLRREWQQTLGFRVSRSLVNARLLKAGLYARRPRRKVLLTPHHCTRRLAWARAHQRISLQQWRHVIFSDEARFEIHRRDGRVRVRRRNEEVYHETCIQPRVHSGGGGLTVWGAFHAMGKSELVVLEGNLNQDRYLRILQETLLPFARITFEANFVYMDDNAPAHRARRVTAFLDGEEVERLPWPACSPDMNPIENLWAELSRQMNMLVNQPTTLVELRASLMAAWDAIPAQTLVSLSDSMPRRVQALLSARGRYTRY
jgi:transposase